jgi:hypothetical protein
MAIHALYNQVPGVLHGLAQVMSRVHVPLLPAYIGPNDSCTFAPNRIWRILVNGKRQDSVALTF